MVCRVSRPDPGPDAALPAGFTLVEVLVAVTLVSVVIVGAGGLLAAASAAIRTGRLSTTATLLAIQKVEQLRADPGLAAGTDEDHVTADGLPAEATSALFVRRWTVGAAGAIASPVLVEVFSARTGRLVELHAMVGGIAP
jgi:prepilin-type N-terminal cleavage/methylation domain-containing protein